MNQYNYLLCCKIEEKISKLQSLGDIVLVLRYELAICVQIIPTPSKVI